MAHQHQAQSELAMAVKHHLPRELNHKIREDLDNWVGKIGCKLWIEIRIQYCLLSVGPVLTFKLRNNHIHREGIISTFPVQFFS